MLRGVNKQIIEVKDTGSRYFERALLFVRPEFAEMRPGQLEAEANKFLATVGRPVSYAARMARMRRRRRLVCAGILGLAVTAAALILLYIL